jgi:excinuclease ABC subunit B
MYADIITDSISNASKETDRRRKKQLEYNRRNKITPQSIVKAIPERAGGGISDSEEIELQVNTKSMTRADLLKVAMDTESTMKKYAEDLDFENAIRFRDKLRKIRKVLGEEFLERD